MSKKRLLLLAAAMATGLIFGAARAAAWHKDPDTTVNLGHLTSLVPLAAPNPTFGDADTTPVGVGTDPVGAGSMTAYAAPAADPTAHTFFVDNTPLDNGCPATTFTTIQAAVNASGPGDTIKVCPGTYTEQVRITGHTHDGLKLQSVKPLQAIIKWPTVETPPLALVDFNMADHVTFTGFTVTGPFTFGGCSPDRHEGLLVESALNEQIDHNHITMIQNSVPALYGCQEGDAVAIGHRNMTQAGSADVDHNQIDEYQKNGVQVVNAGSSAHVDHNTITGSANAAIRAIIASNGVVVFGGASAHVDHNAISGNVYSPTPLSTGIILDEAPNGSSEVDHNSLSGNDYGIETDSQSGLEIDHNDVLGGRGDAITVCGDATQFCGPATGNIVDHNKLQGNGGSGLSLLNADQNLFNYNEIDNNGTTGADTTDGIRVDGNSTGNEILKNHLKSNVTHDCHDDSTGTGTGGTANTWNGDKGDTENKPGLCQPN